MVETGMFEVSVSRDALQGKSAEDAVAIHGEFGGEFETLDSEVLDGSMTSPHVVADDVTTEHEERRASADQVVQRIGEGGSFGELALL